MKRVIAILIMFLGVTLFSQQTDAQKDLLKRAEENYNLVRSDPEKAFQKADEIIKEARKLNVQEAELRAMTTQCAYFEKSSDFENILITARSLFQKSETYNNFAYQSIAKIYLFVAYLFNGLEDKAFKELEYGLKIINKGNENDSLVIDTKSNLYIAFSNYFSFKNQLQDELKYMKLSMREYEKFSNEEHKQRLQRIGYANLASTYIGLNLDSARYYAELSMSKENRNNKDDVSFLNLSILGEVALRNGKYDSATFYFNEAEKIAGYKNHLNIEKLYGNIIETYRITKDDEKVKLYEAKRDSFRLKISENQNKSLHNLLEESEKKDKYYLIYLFGALCISALILSFFVIRKNRILTNQEKISQQYLDEISENPKGENYSKLIEMLRKNDPAFMVYFNETFSDFFSKLLKINPKISSSEMKLCALLKLKIPTKDIARYKYIEPQTVRNKKYLIRKKLRIPKESDIYQWLDSL